MDLEAGLSGRALAKDTPWASCGAILSLTYQSFGVVYGDLSTSPLYVYKSTFSGGLKLRENDEEILGVLSVIFWTLTLIPLLKYVFIVLNADDNGEGGPFALYSLLCRHANLNLLPTRREVDEEILAYKPGKPKLTSDSSAIKEFFENRKRLRIGLLLLVLLGSCMVIGDGVLTPTISVLSAVSGIKVAVSSLDEHVMVVLACIILVGLFALQHYGTYKVAFMFAPIVITWLLCISTIGIYNVAHWNPGVLKSLSPYYMYNFFRKTEVQGWLSLGGILLAITGSEAMFADLGHFSQLSIKIAFTGAVYPCLILAYMGEAAYLSKHHVDIQQSFYKSIPDAVYWPVVVIATLASVVGSQAVISATFSIINQCLGLSCFPHVKVIHTSKDIYGQIYIPEINWILMVLCLAITIGFRDTNLIGHAYGLAVASVMLITTFLTSLVMIIVWRKSMIFALSFLILFGLIEGLFFSSSLMKVPRGGWVPIVLALIFMTIMCVWHYGTCKKYEFELQNKVSINHFLSLWPSLARVPGIGLIYSELTTDLPPVFTHCVTNIPAIHRVVVFVCPKVASVPHVPQGERCLMVRIGPKGSRMFRCYVRYGYKDVRWDEEDFEAGVVGKIGELMRKEEEEGGARDRGTGDEEWRDGKEGMELQYGWNAYNGSYGQAGEGGSDGQLEARSAEVGLGELVRRKKVELQVKKSTTNCGDDELRELFEAKEGGFTFLLGNCCVRARTHSSPLHKFVIDFAFSFLEKNSRGPPLALVIPRPNLLEVGIMYYI